MDFWLEELDDKRDMAVHAVDKRALDIIAEDCKARHNSGLTRTGDGDWHVMRADGWTILNWCNQRGVTWGQFFRDKALQARFIDDPDNSAFRIHKGRV